jgi:hypothetical protein
VLAAASAGAVFTLFALVGVGGTAVPLDDWLGDDESVVEATFGPSAPVAVPDGDSRLAGNTSERVRVAERLGRAPNRLPKRSPVDETTPAAGPRGPEGPVPGSADPGPEGAAPLPAPSPLPLSETIESVVETPPPVVTTPTLPTVPALPALPASPQLSAAPTVPVPELPSGVLP